MKSVNRRKGFTYFLCFKIHLQSKPAHAKTPGLARAAGEQISIEQALIAAGVNLLHPFSPAFCFAVIVCFSLEYKILGLVGEPLVAAGVNPLVPFISTRWFLYINAQPPWPGLDFLLLLDQAKRRGFTIVTPITIVTLITSVTVNWVNRGSVNRLPISDFTLITPDLSADALIMPEQEEH